MLVYKHYSREQIQYTVIETGKIDIQFVMLTLSHFYLPDLVTTTEIHF